LRDETENPKKIVRIIRNTKRKLCYFTGQHRANIGYKSAENMQD